MSDAHTPENRQDASESLGSSASDWYADWAEFSPNAVSPQSGSNPVMPAPEDDWQDWQTVNFPNALSIDAIAQQQPDAAPSTAVDWVMRATPKPSVAMPNGSQLGSEPIAQTNIAELISLIQELNQCNSALIDRVSQLEDALENTKAMQTQPTSTSNPPNQAEVAAMQEQLEQLVTQLESTHQTNQQQQLLIETLTRQLDSSQERIAQLERDYVLQQQRHHEQNHLLIHSETICRDLHARLQRQQRYTLQYKAALEKCLDVTPAPVDIQDESDRPGLMVMQSWNEPQLALAAQTFLPKIQRIQPWSAQEIHPLSSKLENLVSPLPDLTPSPLAEDTSPALEMRPSEAIAPLDVDTEGNPLLTHPFPSQVFPQVHAASASPQTDVTPIPQEPPLHTLHPPVAPLSPDAIQIGLDELRSALGNLWIDPTTEGTSENEEVNLWHDLAQLINASTDDVLKASASDNFESFEQPDAAPSEAVMPEAPVTSSESQPLKLPVSSQEFLNAIANSQGAGATAMTSPSPILYPGRPSKKRESLAAVELPSFPRP